MVKRIKRFKKLLILFFVNHFLLGTHAFELKRKLLNLIPDIQLGTGTKIVGPIYVNGSLDVGDDTWIGHHFSVEGNGHVSIGDRCDIAPFVTCFTGGHKIGDHDRRAGEGRTESIIIGNGCWLGGRSLILHGIKVNDGVVVASGAVVTKNINEDCLVGGVPAKFIKQL